MFELSPDDEHVEQSFANRAAGDVASGDVMTSLYLCQFTTN